MLLKTTQSLCPECLQTLPAEVIEEDDVVYIEKTCPIHGKYRDIYWSDYDLYEWAKEWDFIGDGLENPRTQKVKGCPNDCGICPNHKSHTVLAIIDVTNRCNLNCPICFAYAGAVGYVYEPSKEQVQAMLRNLRENKPVPGVALQFSGGEPTLREDLPELVKMATDVGIDHVEVNSNGIVLSRNLDYFKKLIDAGMSTIYLQFDGLTDDVYLRTRGVPLAEVKMKVVENARKLGFDSVMLVVTLVRGINDHELGDIIRFAAVNSDVVRGINVQPVSICGRIPREEREKMRITIPDFMKLVEKQTDGAVKTSDFRPVTWPLAISKAVGAIKGRRYVEFTANPLCGVATFIIPEDGGRKIVPITKYADVDGFVKALWKAYDDAVAGKKVKARMRLIGSARYVKGRLFRSLIARTLTTGAYEALGEVMRKMVLLGCMHFMDAYNFDLDRVNRCCIHYLVPDGRLIPFCTMNTLHRPTIEKKLSVPLEEYMQKKAGSLVHH